MVGEIVVMPPTTAVILLMSERGMVVTIVTVILGIEAATSVRMTPEMLLRGLGSSSGNYTIIYQQE